jgi:hypothetical protein
MPTEDAGGRDAARRLEVYVQSNSEGYAQAILGESRADRYHTSIKMAGIPCRPRRSLMLVGPFSAPLLPFLPSQQDLQVAMTQTLLVLARSYYRADPSLQWLPPVRPTVPFQTHRP